MAKRPEGELLSYAVEGAGAVTASPLGYLAFLNDDESVLTMYAWSKSAMAECAMREKPITYPVEKNRALGRGGPAARPVITNDYQEADIRKKGYPEGHPHIIRHMNVPVIDGSRIVIVAGVANKPQDYTENEVRELTLLMQGLWQVLKVPRAEEELRAANEQLMASGEELRGQYEGLLPGSSGSARARRSTARSSRPPRKGSGSLTGNSAPCSPTGKCRRSSGTSRRRWGDARSGTSCRRKMPDP